MSNYKTVFFTLGILQIILGISMFIPIITQFIFDEVNSGFISSSIVSIIFGVLFYIFGPRTRARWVQMRQAPGPMDPNGPGPRPNATKWAGPGPNCPLKSMGQE